jgi:hypothetical protein
MLDDNLDHEIAELSARIATAEEELKQFREELLAMKNKPVYDELIRAAEMKNLQDQRRELLEGLQRQRMRD